MKSIVIFNNCVKKRIKILSILTFIFVITIQQAVMAQDFPIKPITLMIPYGAGGPTDLAARTLAEILKEILGQPIVVVNKPGGGGIIAPSILAKEKPDGYNLSVTPTIALAQIPQMRDVGFDPLNDFEFIARHMSFVGGIFCLANKPWKSMKDLLDYSKQNPGKVSYGTPGFGTSCHTATEFIQAKERIKWRMIPYDGSVKLVSALLGGHIDLIPGESASIKGHLKSGEVRILAVEGLGKEEFPGVPTFEEFGYELTVGGQFGIIAPKGTPAPILKKLQDSFKKAIEDPRYEAICNKIGVLKTYLSGEDYFKLIKKEYELRGRIVRELNLDKK